MGLWSCHRENAIKGAYTCSPGLTPTRCRIVGRPGAPSPCLVVMLSLIHISEPTRPERISYAVFCLKKKRKNKCSGTSLLRDRRSLDRIENAYGYFFPRAMLMLRETARKAASFSEPANCNEVMIMSLRKCDEACLSRHTTSPGVTPTRRRSVGQPGAPSPRLVVIP